MYEAFREAARWRNIIGLRYVNDLNGKIRTGKGKELIMLFEALQEKRVAQLADTILKEKKRIILIAGPSSSGRRHLHKGFAYSLRLTACLLFTSVRMTFFWKGHRPLKMRTVNMTLKI